VQRDALRYYHGVSAVLYGVDLLAHMFAMLVPSLMSFVVREISFVGAIFVRVMHVASTVRRVRVYERSVEVRVYETLAEVQSCVGRAHITQKLTRTRRAKCVPSHLLQHVIRKRHQLKSYIYMGYLPLHILQTSPHV